MPAGTAYTERLPVEWWHLETVQDLPRLLLDLIVNRPEGKFEIKPYAGRKANGEISFYVAINNDKQNVVVNLDEVFVIRVDTGEIRSYKKDEFTSRHEDFVLT